MVYRLDIARCLCSCLAERLIIVLVVIIIGVIFSVVDTGNAGVRHRIDIPTSGTERKHPF